MWAERFPTWQLVEGHCPDGPWRKGLAVADALSRAEHDVIVVADADVWTDGVEEAVVKVRAGVAWAVPHHRVLRLTPIATEEAIASGEWPKVRTSLTYMQSPYIGHPGGGMVVLTKDLYRRAPIDPRFEGWGQEDDSWAHALRVMAGREWRGTADLWHLWHPTPPRMSREFGSAASKRLYLRYARARDRVTMGRLLAEHQPAEAVA